MENIYGRKRKIVKDLESGIKQARGGLPEAGLVPSAAPAGSPGLWECVPWIACDSLGSATSPQRQKVSFRKLMLKMIPVCDNAKEFCLVKNVNLYK